MGGPSGLYVRSAYIGTILLESDGDTGPVNLSESIGCDVDYAQEENWNEWA